MLTGSGSARKPSSSSSADASPNCMLFRGGAIRVERLARSRRRRRAVDCLRRRNSSSNARSNSRQTPRPLPTIYSILPISGGDSALADVGVAVAGAGRLGGGLEAALAAVKTAVDGTDVLVVGASDDVGGGGVGGESVVVAVVLGGAAVVIGGVAVAVVVGGVVVDAVVVDGASVVVGGVVVGGDVVAAVVVIGATVVVGGVVVAAVVDGGVVVAAVVTGGAVVGGDVVAAVVVIGATVVVGGVVVAAAVVDGASVVVGGAVVAAVVTGGAVVGGDVVAAVVVGGATVVVGGVVVAAVVVAAVVDKMGAAARIILVVCRTAVARCPSVSSRAGASATRDQRTIHGSRMTAAISCDCAQNGAAARIILVVCRTAVARCPSVSSRAAARTTRDQRAIHGSRMTAAIFCDCAQNGAAARIILVVCRTAVARCPSVSSRAAARTTRDQRAIHGSRMTAAISCDCAQNGAAARIILVVCRTAVARCPSVSSRTGASATRDQRTIHGSRMTAAISCDCAQNGAAARIIRHSLPHSRCTLSQCIQSHRCKCNQRPAYHSRQSHGRCNFLRLCTKWRCSSDNSHSLPHSRCTLSQCIQSHRCKCNQRPAYHSRQSHDRCNFLRLCTRWRCSSDNSRSLPHSRCTLSQCIQSRRCKCNQRPAYHSRQSHGRCNFLRLCTKWRCSSDNSHSLPHSRCTLSQCIQSHRCKCNQRPAYHSRQSHDRCNFLRLCTRWRCSSDNSRSLPHSRCTLCQCIQSRSCKYNQRSACHSRQVA